MVPPPSPREIHTRLRARGKSAKGWANSCTEVEYLGDGRFAANVSVDHRVFKDKSDGEWKRRKLTDNRPDHVVIQGAKCCVEVYPWYAKYFDVHHEEVRLHEERWVIQRLFKTPDKWRDVGAWNPVMAVEESADAIRVAISYETDYGPFVLEYLQRDGAPLKHDLTFKNTSGGEETFRVLQRWAGIVGAKCNGQDFPLDVDEPVLRFHRADKPEKEFTISENLWGMIFEIGEWEEDEIEKTEHCLQRPVKIEGHARGMKADFVYGNWVLAHNENLIIDPITVTITTPTLNEYIKNSGARYPGSPYIGMALKTSVYTRGDIEWNISVIPDNADVSSLQFRYNGIIHKVDCHIHDLLTYRPTTSTGLQVFSDAGAGAVYAAPAGFPATGSHTVTLSAQARTDFESQLSSDWFAIGIQSDLESSHTGRSAIYSGSDLIVTYTVPVFSNQARLVGTIRALYSLKARLTGAVRAHYSLKVRVAGAVPFPYATKVRHTGTVIYGKWVRLMGKVAWPYSVKYRQEGEVFQWWHYRMPVTITEVADGSYAQFPTIVTVPWNLHMADDFSDCRFTEADGQSIIPHGIVSKMDGVYCSFLILRDYTPSYVHNLYLYYGNPGVADTSLAYTWWAESWYLRQGIGPYSSSRYNKWCNHYPYIARGIIPAWAGVITPEWEGTVFGGVQLDGAKYRAYYGRVKINGYPVAWATSYVCNGLAHSRLLRWGKFYCALEQYDHPQFAPGGQNTFTWGHYDGTSPGWRCSWYPAGPSTFLGAEQAGKWPIYSMWVRLIGTVRGPYSTSVRVKGNVGYGVRVRNIGTVGSFSSSKVRMDGAVAGLYQELVRLKASVGSFLSVKVRNTGFVHTVYTAKARNDGFIIIPYTAKARLTGFIYGTYGARVRHVGVALAPYEKAARTVGYACPEICRVAYTRCHSELEAR